MLQNSPEGIKCLGSRVLEEKVSFQMIFQALQKTDTTCRFFVVDCVVLFFYGLLCICVAIINCADAQ